MADEQAEWQEPLLSDDRLSVSLIDIIGINRQVTKNAKKCSKSPRSALGVPI
jgi:hypothetical protein